MFKLIVKLILFLFLISVLISCKTNAFDIDREIDKGTILTGKLKNSIPLDGGKPDWIYKEVKDQTRQLGLDSCESGKKDFELRIWLLPWLYIKKNLVILGRNNGIWSGRLITTTEKYNDSLQKHCIAGHETSAIVPVRGWNQFFSSLNDLQFFNLPDMNELPGYITGDDGTDLVLK